jgi:hypothetical protein
MSIGSIIKYMCIGAILMATACIKQTDKHFQGTTVVEFDATVLNSVATGVTYPVLTQVPEFGKPLDIQNTNCNSAFVDPFIKRTSGTVQLRVNVVGPVSKEARAIGFKVVDVPVTSVTFRQTSPCSNVTLTTVGAAAGVHYAFADTKITIPADSSFGYLNINILNAGATAGQARTVGIQLDSTQSLLPSVNYRTIAVAIDQR